jgi:hypothetical protein
MFARLVMLAAVVALLVSCGSGHRTSTTTAKGFLDVNTLETNVKAQGDRILRKHPSATNAPPGAHIKDVTCVKSEAARRTFECRLSYSTGDHETLAVLVSGDGSRWIPERVVP